MTKHLFAYCSTSKMPAVVDRVCLLGEKGLLDGWEGMGWLQYKHHSAESCNYTPKMPKHVLKYHGGTMIKASVGSPGAKKTYCGMVNGKCKETCFEMFSENCPMPWRGQRHLHSLEAGASANQGASI